MSADNPTIALVKRLLSDKDFSTLAEELPRLSKYLTGQLAQEAWKAVAQYQEIKGEIVAAIIAYSRARIDSGDNPEVVQGFLIMLRRYWEDSKAQLTKSDIDLVVVLVLRLVNYYRIKLPKHLAIRQLLESLLSDMSMVRKRALRAEAGPLTAEVTQLCFGLEDEMSIEEVRVEMAKLLVPDFEEMLQSGKMIVGIDENKKGKARQKGRK